eukprot:ANDGO_03859.mRNA.1 Pre-mRNA-splicing factor 18
MNPLDDILALKKSELKTSNEKQKFRRKGDELAALKAQLLSSVPAKRSISEISAAKIPDEADECASVPSDRSRRGTDDDAGTTDSTADNQMSKLDECRKLLGLYSTPESLFAIEGRDDLLSKPVQSFHVLTRLLKLWNARLVLNAELPREEQNEELSAGLFSEHAYRLEREFIQPLLDLLSADALSADLARQLWSILSYVRVRDYQKADNCYLQMAIGNATWPLGISSVDIHERRARERIRDTKVKSMLKDDTSRKYLQSLKKLLSFSRFQYGLSAPP